MRIAVDRAAYDSKGLCMLEAPDLLAIDENDEPKVLTAHLTAKLLSPAERAVRVCPKAALTVIDETNG